MNRFENCNKTCKGSLQREVSSIHSGHAPLSLTSSAAAIVNVTRQALYIQKMYFQNKKIEAERKSREPSSDECTSISSKS